MSFVLACRGNLGDNEGTIITTPEEEHLKVEMRKVVGMPLPREHGAWAMFIVPIVLGIATAHTIDLPILVFVITAFGFVLFRYPIMLTIKSRSRQSRRENAMWGIAYALLSVVGGGLLVATVWNPLFIPLALLGAFSLTAYLWNAWRRAEMTIWGEWVGILGLALGAPGVYVTATGRLDATAIITYLLNVLYFGGNVFYVRYRVLEQRLVAPDATWPARLWSGRVTISYHVIAILAIAVASVIGAVPLLVLFAFLLTLGKAITGIIARPLARPNIRRIGMVELAMTVLFTACVSVAYL